MYREIKDLRIANNRRGPGVKKANLRKKYRCRGTKHALIHDLFAKTPPSKYRSHWRLQNIAVSYRFNTFLKNRPLGFRTRRAFLTSGRECPPPFPGADNYRKSLYSPIMTAVMSPPPPLPSAASSHPVTPLPSKLKGPSAHNSNNSSDDDENPGPLERTMSGASNRSLRPRIGPRQSSGTMIVPADHPEVEIKSETYAPNDARSFSPRRTPEETEKMLGGKREALQRYGGSYYACPAHGSLIPISL